MAHKADSPFGEIDFRLLAKNIEVKRKETGIGLRAAAAEAGVSYSTLYRLERGTGKPDLDTLERVLAWLQVSPSALLSGAQPIRAHLRAAKNLPSEVATALASAARIAHERFDKPSADQDADMTRVRSVRRPRRIYQRRGIERLAVQFRQAIRCELDVALDPFKLRINGIEVKDVNALDLPFEMREVLTDSYGKSWSAITLPRNDAETDWLIVLNPSHTIQRQRATLMEEMCHILLGHELSTLSQINDQTFREYHEHYEREAYGLGAAILVPRDPLVERVLSGRSSEEIGKHFGVSAALVEYRIKVSGAWYDYKLRQHVAAKTNVSE